MNSFRTTYEDRVHTTYNGRSLASVISELKDEAREFLDTRVSMLIAELKEKAAAWKTAMPMMVVGAVMLVMAFMLVTGAIVAAIAVAFGDNPFAPAIALIIVAVAYGLFGGIAVLFGWRNVSETGLAPKRTMRVLKEDQLWLRNEARTHV